MFPGYAEPTPYSFPNPSAFTPGFAYRLHRSSLNVVSTSTTTSVVGMSACVFAY